LEPGQLSQSKKTIAIKENFMSFNQRITVLVTLSLSLFLGSGVFSIAIASTPAMKQMAEIMHRLKHFPSPQGKEILRGIAKNKSTTNNERTLASAILNMEHEVTPQYKSDLEDMTASASTTADEKAFANILLNFSHRPSDADKKRLETMMK
jgi:hypothetical protein